MSKYLAKILGNDPESLQMIAALSSGATVKVSDIKYLSSNKVFLLSIERMNKEKERVPRRRVRHCGCAKGPDLIFQGKTVHK